MNRVFLVGLLAVGLSAQAATPYSDWQHSGTFYIITTPEGADLPASATESNFPLLVRLNSGNFNFGEAQPGGEDIRFASGEGTPLAYQIEQWDPASDTASVWVRIPNIKGNSRQEIEMFWGKAGAASESNGKAVFNESNGHVCVFHMNDPVKDDAGALDAKDTGTTSSSGVIGKSRRLDVGKGINCGESITTLPTGSNPHSTELWIRPEKLKVVPVAWGNEQAQGKTHMNFQRRISLDCYFSGASVASKSPLGLSQWIHVVHTYKKGESRVYVNGVLDGESITNDGHMNIQTPARMYLGGWYGNYSFVGDIDEVRVSKVTRSADWVKMEYENQKPMQALVGPLVGQGNDFSLSHSSLAMKEGQRVNIIATAGGAQKLWWILKSGDQEEVVAVDRFRLPFDAGRVETNSSRVLRFKAIYPGGTKMRDIAISIEEAIPDPEFTVDAPATWDGCTPITVSAKMANLEQMRAKGAGALQYKWNVSGLATLTEIANDTLTLKRAHLSGPLTITLSVHNGGALTTRSAIINVAEPSKRATVPAVLKADAFKHYIDRFNADDEELYVNNPNTLAWQFIEKNVPLFECPDKDIEQTYYFRWWTFRKHIKLTPDGFVITEFLPTVPWSGKYNTINCPLGHHYYEGRWLHDARYLDDCSLFWLRKGGSLVYSVWIADAFYARQLVTPNKDFLVALLDDLIKVFGTRESGNRGTNGLFRQGDGWDGMECSIGGSGYRATISSYMYGDAVAIAKIATLAGRKDVAEKFEEKAKDIKNNVQAKLWDSSAQFFKVLPEGENTSLVDVRELHGFTPWYFNLPDKGKGYEVAWKQLMDPKGFYAPYGPTTAEQRHPKFTISYTGHGCQWNGPSWPLSTAITLVGLANVLNNYEQDAISKDDYMKILKIYAQSHRRTLDDGRVVAWIDENIDPFTGVWIARKRTAEQNAGFVKKGALDEVIYERGKDYNHSSFCDLIITGLVGLRPRADDVVEVHPLVPDGKWDWFCLDKLVYHGRTLTILWDMTGTKYGRGKGLRVFADGREIGGRATLGRMTANLPRK
ncbi:MAG: DUF2341 domain-containing protein [Verrucomicrobia bacterium]|nr:DUF2341 domain-containing protein [Verrucomicrobiota bacterium]